MTEYVNIKISHGVAEIEFFHPKSNSLPSLILKELAEKITEAGNDSSAKVIKLTSYGEKAFCSGASFDELININDFEVGKHFFSGFAKVINAMRKAPKFIVTEVQGKVVGGGVGLVAASDYVLAVKGADMKLSELALGIGPFVVGPAVERKIGTAAFSEMAIDYEWMPSDWCYEKGFYNKYCKNIKELNNETEKFIEKMKRTSLDAMSEFKKVLWEGTEHWDTLLIERAEISGKLVLSDFTKDYIKEFKVK